MCPTIFSSAYAAWSKQRAEGAGGQAANRDANPEQEQYSLFEALLGDED